MTNFWYQNQSVFVDHVRDLYLTHAGSVADSFGGMNAISIE